MTGKFNNARNSTVIKREN